MKTLRDFQRHTSRHAFRRLFTTPDASPRFLVADEVGLGKTLVARGVIAQTIDHLRAQGDQRIDIVYVASNAAIANQNVRKLKIDGVDVQHRAGRLSLLPFRIDELDQRDINVIALTPGTSLDLRGSNGVFRERAAVYRTLQSVWGRSFMNGMGAARTCFYGISEQHGSQYAKSRLVTEAEDLGPLREPMRTQVRQMMGERDARSTAAGRPTLREDFSTLKQAYAYSRRSWPRDTSHRRQQFIRDMREILASAGVYALRPDLVILDEFQRFRDLIRLPDEHSVDRQGEPEGDPFAGQLAREIFDYHHEVEGRRTRVLMLSATPYAMHTTSEEIAAGSERHYEDFLNTYRFLVDNDHKAVEQLKTRLQDLRSAIYDARYGGVEPAINAAEAVSRQLLKVMSRTERLAVTEDRDGMLTEVPSQVPTPSPGAIRQYLAADAISQHVGSGDPIDFWKSAAYPMSFLGGMKYDVTRRILGRLDATPRRKTRPSSSPTRPPCSTGTPSGNTNTSTQTTHASICCGTRPSQTRPGDCCGYRPPCLTTAPAASSRRTQRADSPSDSSSAHGTSSPPPSPHSPAMRLSARRWPVATAAGAPAASPTTTRPPPGTRRGSGPRTRPT